MKTLEMLVGRVAKSLAAPSAGPIGLPRLPMLRICSMETSGFLGFRTVQIRAGAGQPVSFHWEAVGSGQAGWVPHGGRRFFLFDRSPGTATTYDSRAETNGERLVDESDSVDMFGGMWEAMEGNGIARPVGFARQACIC